MFPKTKPELGGYILLAVLLGMIYTLVQGIHEVEFLGKIVFIDRLAVDFLDTLILGTLPITYAYILNTAYATSFQSFPLRLIFRILLIVLSVWLILLVLSLAYFCIFSSPFPGDYCTPISFVWLPVVITLESALSFPVPFLAGGFFLAGYLGSIIRRIEDRSLRVASWVSTVRENSPAIVTGLVVTYGLYFLLN